MTENTHGGPGRGQGRKPLYSEKTVKRNVTLLPSQVEAMEKLGNGNLSAGIRKAIDMNMQKPSLNSKPNYDHDPVTRLAYDVYQAAYQPYGEANPDKVGEIENWLREGDLDDSPSVDELAAEWLAFTTE